MSATTFTPAQNTGAEVCPAPSEGTAKLYTMNYLTGSSIEPNGERGEDAGGGIPGELLVIIREEGTTAWVPGSGGGKYKDLEMDAPRYKTYWFDE